MLFLGMEKFDCSEPAKSRFRSKHTPQIKLPHSICYNCFWRDLIFLSTKPGNSKPIEWDLWGDSDRFLSLAWWNLLTNKYCQLKGIQDVLNYYHSGWTCVFLSRIRFGRLGRDFAYIYWHRVVVTTKNITFWFFSRFDVLCMEVGTCNYLLAIRIKLPQLTDSLECLERGRNWRSLWWTFDIFWRSF